MFLLVEAGQALWICDCQGIARKICSSGISGSVIFCIEARKAGKSFENVLVGCSQFSAALYSEFCRFCRLRAALIN